MSILLAISISTIDIVSLIYSYTSYYDRREHISNDYNLIGNSTYTYTALDLVPNLTRLQAEHQNLLSEFHKIQLIVIEAVTLSFTLFCVSNTKTSKFTKSICHALSYLNLALTVALLFTEVNTSLQRENDGNESS